MGSENQDKQKADTIQLSQEALKVTEEVQKLQKPEERLRLYLDKMKGAVSQETNPDFKLFWELRSLCLSLFKETLQSFSRKNLWQEYVSLTDEAKHLKGILDEQSAFTAEQIDLALQALEADLQDDKKLLELIPKVDFPKESKAVQKMAHFYERLQKQANLLNTFASRLSSLRKELIRTEMRIRLKNKFFKRVTAVGDLIYPKRKDLIEQLSNQFLKDVNEFIDLHFQNGEVKVPYYVLREEIKALQGVSKNLTLTSEVFTETRKKLSESWDVIRQLEKQRKKYITEKKSVFFENKKKIFDQIENLREKIQKGLQPSEMKKELISISNSMRKLDLGKEEVRDLKRQISEIKKPYEEDKLKEKQEKEEKQKQVLEEKKAKIEELKTLIEEAVKNQEDEGVDALNRKYEEIQEKAKALELSKYERQFFERALKPLKDLIASLKEKALLDLSKDDLKSLEKLKQILEERKKRKKEIKLELEHYRKDLGSSGFDFEKAMVYRDMIDLEKKRLENANNSIEEIEEKISKFEGR